MAKAAKAANISNRPGRVGPQGPEPIMLRGRATMPIRVRKTGRRQRDS